jgi:hypothetical protein
MTTMEETDQPESRNEEEMEWAKMEFPHRGSMRKRKENEKEWPGPPCPLSGLSSKYSSQRSLSHNHI